MIRRNSSKSDELIHLAFVILSDELEFGAHLRNLPACDRGGEGRRRRCEGLLFAAGSCRVLNRKFFT